MVYKFNDKNKTIKHLSFIIGTKKITSTTLLITESYMQGSVTQDLLFYSHAKMLDKDIKKFFKELRLSIELVNHVTNSPGFNESEEE